MIQTITEPKVTTNEVPLALELRIKPKTSPALETEPAPASQSGAPEPERQVHTMQHLVDVLDEFEQRLQEVRQVARASNGRYAQFQAKAERAEGQQRILEIENARLRGLLEHFERKVPRWMRRLLGATPP